MTAPMSVRNAHARGSPIRLQPVNPGRGRNERRRPDRTRRNPDQLSAARGQPEPHHDQARPPPPPPPPLPPPPATPPAMPAPSPDARTGRRSPLDALAALPDPGLTPPLLPVPGPQVGPVPATFRNQPDDRHPGTPGIGALSMAATLAVAIACLRGTHTVLSTGWETRQARRAETAPLREARLKHQAAMQGILDKA